MNIFAVLDKNQQLAEFLKFIKESADLLTIFQAVQKDSTTNNNVDNTSMDQS